MNYLKVEGINIVIIALKIISCRVSFFFIKKHIDMNNDMDIKYD